MKGGAEEKRVGIRDGEFRFKKWGPNKLGTGLGWKTLGKLQAGGPAGAAARPCLRPAEVAAA